MSAREAISWSRRSRAQRARSRARTPPTRTRARACARSDHRGCRRRAADPRTPAGSCRRSTAAGSSWRRAPRGSSAAPTLRIVLPIADHEQAEREHAQRLPAAGVGCLEEDMQRDSRRARCPDIGPAPRSRTLILRPGYARRGALDGQGRRPACRAQPRNWTRSIAPRRARGLGASDARLLGGAGDRQDAPVDELAKRADAAGHVLGQRVRARGRPAVLGLRRRPRRVRRRTGPAGSRARATTCAASSGTCCPSCRTPRRAARRPSRTSATAPTAPCASCSSASRRAAARAVLDDVHWADAASVELLAALLRRPPRARAPRAGRAAAAVPRSPGGGPRARRARAA